MLVHIVLWNITEEYKENKEEVMEDIKKDLLNLKEKIQVIEDIKVGKNISHEDKDKRDIGLILKVKNDEDLKTYAEHPEHLKVVASMKDKLKDRVVLDYYLD